MPVPKDHSFFFFFFLTQIYSEKLTIHTIKSGKQMRKEKNGLLVRATLAIWPLVHGGSYCVRVSITLARKGTIRERYVTDATVT
ncbi:hypothetical protein M153_6718000713 [Pseudoloma neurophilia]|uniref:Uncharacterized protein n=1 Tax=Pseudoloma neurophilia TaxID=146866 RepID=A0A0R0LSA9_9MICR|nr:hypothetical protein M153_6718000713 [Pseudoloma neurophilia]